MKTRIKEFIIVLILISSSPALAEYINVNSFEFQNAGNKICFGEQIMEEVLKEAVTAVGKRVIEKYINGNSTSTTQNNTNNSQQNSPTTTNSTTTINPIPAPASNTQNTNVQNTAGTAVQPAPANVEEELIIIK